MVLAVLALAFVTIVVSAVLKQGPAFMDAVTAFLVSVREGIARSSLPSFIKEGVADLFTSSRAGPRRSTSGPAGGGSTRMKKGTE